MFSQKRAQNNKQKLQTQHKWPPLGTQLPHFLYIKTPNYDNWRFSFLRKMPLTPSQMSISTSISTD